MDFRLQSHSEWEPQKLKDRPYDLLQSTSTIRCALEQFLCSELEADCRKDQYSNFASLKCYIGEHTSRPLRRQIGDTGFGDDCPLCLQTKQ